MGVPRYSRHPETISPEDPKLSPLLCTTKERYLAHLSVHVHLDEPNTMDYVGGHKRQAPARRLDNGAVSGMSVPILRCTFYWHKKPADYAVPFVHLINIAKMRHISIGPLATVVDVDWFAECRPENATIVPRIQRLSRISDDFRQLQGTSDVWSQTFESRWTTVNIWLWTLDSRHLASDLRAFKRSSNIYVQFQHSTHNYKLNLIIFLPLLNVS